MKKAGKLVRTTGGPPLPTTLLLSRSPDIGAIGLLHILFFVCENAGKKWAKWRRILKNLSATFPQTFETNHYTCIWSKKIHKF